METPQKKPRKKSSRPKEVSSKAPILPEAPKPVTNRRRDPRFDPLCGHLNEDMFRKSYNFLDEYRDAEMTELQRTIKKARNQESVALAQKALTRMQQQQSRQERTDRMHKIKTEFRAKERELIKEGKQPFFLKRGDLRRLSVMEHIDELKRSGKLSKALARRRRHTAAKQHKKLPWKRRDQEELAESAMGHGPPRRKRE
eukprot:gnl/Trimastix_PCT/2078.p1 GENE.gnl/Trimastix_PCT/2078~~gnl/Trimastix_PCT/2078.p1  ORF type:complete len:199 (-),score=34.24 gnl/Trimastix_PCT/2078:48-644(-)